LKPLKTSNIVIGVPLVFLMGVSSFSLLKWLKEDYPHLNQSPKTAVKMDNK